MSSRSTSPKPPSTSSLKAGLNSTKLHPETVFPSDLNLTSDVDWTFDKAVGGPPEQRSAGRCQCRETDDNEAGCLDESCFNFACMEECGPSCQHPNCGNQNISKKKWRPLEICPTPNKGHGLFAIKPIPKRSFIIEYCGEVVGERKLNERFAQYQAKNDRMLYILELSKGLYIDARSKGGVARFINHSCKPNCTMEKWKVRGNYRMVVFALRDIKKDEELTFDYKWDRRKGRPRTKCYCGVEECRGYLETDTAPVFEEVDGEGKKVGDWRKPTPNETGITLVGQTIKIYFEGNYSYLEAEVDDYNPDMGNYKVRYLCDDEVAEEKLVMKDIFIFDEKITNDIKKRKGRTSLSSKVNVYDGDEDRNETGAIISSKGGVDDRSTNLFISRGCHEFITKKTIIPEMQSKYGVRADQKLTKRSSLNLDDLETITDLNAQMTHFIGITFTGPGNAPTLALDSLKKWIEIFKSQLPPPAPAALPAHNQYEAPSHADVFSSQTTCYVCCPEASTSTLKMVVDSLQSQSVAVSISNKQTKVSLHDPTTTLTTFTFLSGSPDMEKWFQEQAYNQFKNDGEHLLFGREFLESWTQLTQDSTYIQTLSESIAAPVHVTSPAANQPKPMIWYGCNPNDLGLVHNGVISRAVDSLKGSKFVFAPSPVFNPIKDRVLQFLNGQATYVEPWLQITALNNTQQTAEELQSIVSTCLSHQNHLSSKSCAHPFFSSKPSPPPLLSPSDAETMAAELIILGQVCESGGLKGALRRRNIHASTLCGMFWSGGKPLAARILAITSLYMAHKSSSCLLTKPMRLHSLEDVVDVYYQTIYPNNVMDRQGEEMLDICRRVISLETEVADKLGWRLGTAYGDWVWWKILDIEQNGKVKELSQPILNARAVATSGQVGSSDGGRFVAETDGIDLAVAAYAMFQFDDSITKKVSQSLLNGSPSGAAKAFSGILTAVENKKTEKYKDHFRVKSLITSSNKNNPFLSHNHAAAPPTTTRRAYVSGVAMQFHTIASDLNLTAISESVQDGGVTLIGGEKVRRHEERSDELGMR
ncbi:hypothetical protein TL16_g03870 [Triparma laevis f. inornata]|uniref:Histone-lysine N-methyltransferase n=1 Tax=Triparma laevis f. inornata TaxID=1714386 RepID=A0A9W7A171_9STRA|nr:hypothetical protein TL16_g03870 [Triparma laevis f. inornata]